MTNDSSGPSLQRTINRHSTKSSDALWHCRTVDAVIDSLNTDSKNGLSHTAAKERLAKFGENSLLTIGQQTWLRVFARQFVDVLVLILAVAAVISLIIGDIGDTLTILVIIVFNGTLGFVQEWQAERAIDALRQMLEPHCTVVRGGQQAIVDARTLVPGDIVILNTGDKVPADLRLINTVSLKTDESLLTGESGSTNKSPMATASEVEIASRSSIAHMGTSVTNGHGRGIVVETGMDSEFGEIAQLTQTVEREHTPLQKQLKRLGKQLGLISIGVSILVAVVGTVMGQPAMLMFMTAVSLAVAIVPEGLPAVVTITLALGVRAMIRKRALLRRLQAAETLGSATVICTDKTGTLTQNKMLLTKIWMPDASVHLTGTGYQPTGTFVIDDVEVEPARYATLMELLQVGLNCSHARVQEDDSAWTAIGEPTEAAVVTAALKAGLSTELDTDHCTEFSFDSDRKRMTIVEQRGADAIAYSKGAPEVILERCTQIRDATGSHALTDAERSEIQAAYKTMASDGLRTLAISVRKTKAEHPLLAENVETDMVFLGVVGIIDPPHAEVPLAIQMAHSAGIRTIMITGDSPETAQAIAERVGMQVDTVTSGIEVRSLSDVELDAQLRRNILFARTAPADKMRIVQRLQDMGHVVAMTGDGINDAPALKKADVGIAMGLHGTDVARSASDLVLTDDNFASIVAAVKQGRRQYDNIKKFVHYLLSSNTGEIVAIFLNIAVGGPLLFVPVQILWMNLVTDGMTAIALGVEPAEANLMQRRPRDRDEAILDRRGLIQITLIGAYIGLVTLVLFQYYLADKDPQRVLQAQTIAFTAIVVLEKINVFNFRARYSTLAEIGFFSNPWVIVAWSATMLLQVLAVYSPLLQEALHTVPLGLADWALIFVVAMPVLLIPELVKRFTAKHYDSETISTSAS
jgi:Ca2+-transporting ATPase